MQPLANVILPWLSQFKQMQKTCKPIANNEWAMRCNISNIQENVENSTKNKTIQRKRRKTKSLLNNINKFIYKK